jgi:uncharacterized protein (TIGR01777 family)
MKYLVTGATGLVGSHFVRWAEARGHQCAALSRRPRNSHDIRWDPALGLLDSRRLAGFDAVIHLAGENISTGRWTAEKKSRIHDSRVDGTALLCERLLQAEPRPAVLVSASAIGYYGDRGDELLDEQSAPGSSFLSQVCREWEQATAPAAAAGIRVANARIGVVLSPAGGALKAMLLPFRFGAGGVVGSGRQYWSWIGIDDLVAAFGLLSEDVQLAGPVNMVAPEPTTNRQFTKTLGRVLGRPTLLPMPAFAARLLLGEMADELLLASTRVYPRKLLAAGFSYRQGELATALSQMLT